MTPVSTSLGSQRCARVPLGIATPARCTNVVGSFQARRGRALMAPAALTARSSGCGSLASRDARGRRSALQLPQLRVGRAAAATRTLRAVAVLEAPTAADEVLSNDWYDAGGIRVQAIQGTDRTFRVTVTADDARPMVLHWAVDDWKAPSSEFWPPGTHQVDDKAVQTPFEHGRSVTLKWPFESAPERIVFVLKELQPENWISNGSNYTVQLKPPGLDAVLDKVVHAESTWDHYTLLNRFNLANEHLDALYAAPPEGPAFMFVWLRLSAQKLLDWDRNGAYQSKDMAWVQKVITERVSEKARGAKDPWSRLYSRLAVAGLPRGGGNGDDIRHGILNVMRENGIKEGHRPGLDEPFLEQWHQKLHQNTTPEDVTICEAYLAFLHSGSHDDYWRVLWDNGKITRERLEAMRCPLKAWPKHLPHLIPAMSHYLWILKTCHSGADLDTAAECAKNSLDDDTRWQLFDMLKNRNEWWVPGKIAEVRERLAGVWRTPGASRDVLLLDIALDNYFRTCIERTDYGALSRDDLLELVALVARNASLTCESEDLSQCSWLWDRLRTAPGRWSHEWGLAALAAVERAEVSLAAYGDAIYSHVQPHAEAFGKACTIDEAYITNFGEEVVRGQSVFVMSQLLQRLEPMVRESAGASAWQVVSHAAATGEVRCYPSLADIQGQTFDRPVVVLAERVGGMEDIPPGVVAVLTEGSTDVLSHVAIRARSQGVLMASCADDALYRRIADMQGQYASLTVTATGDVTATPVDAATAAASFGGGNGGGGELPRLTLGRTQASSAWALGEAAFNDGVVGAKARNLAQLRHALPSWIQVPASVSLPFGTFERVLRAPENAEAARQLQALEGEIAAASNASSLANGLGSALKHTRQLVSSRLVAPQGLAQELESVASAAGLAQPGQWTSGGRGWSEVWSAICQVWASKWGDRAFLSRRAYGVGERDLVMSVLLQQVVAADYAFVAHTADPVSGHRGRLLGEVVVGLGETLVGNHPGRALAFHNSDGHSQLLSLPSKRTALLAPSAATLIARSDANGEDLESFAGAGLYDSVPVVPLVEVTVDMAAEALVWDASRRGEVMDAVARASWEVERAMGGQPQDIEGCWEGGKVTVVQARPQVL